MENQVEWDKINLQKESMEKNLIELVFRRSEKQVSEIIINSNLAREHFQNLNYNALLSDCIRELRPSGGILTGIKWVRKNTKKKWLVCFPVDSPFFLRT